MTVAERLAARIREEAPADIFPDPLTVSRTRAGRAQMAAGAWSWFVDGPIHAGSFNTMAECLAAKRLRFTQTWVGWEIWPEND